MKLSIMRCMSSVLQGRESERERARAGCDTVGGSRSACRSAWAQRESWREREKDRQREGEREIYVGGKRVLSLSASRFGGKLRKDTHGDGKAGTETSPYRGGGRRTESAFPHLHFPHQPPPSFLNGFVAAAREFESARERRCTKK